MLRLKLPLRLMNIKNNASSHIISRSHEGKVLVVNFSKKVEELSAENSEYLKILAKARLGIYPRFLPMNRMNPAEQLAFENRLEKLIDIVANDYDEDRIEDARDEASFVQKALIHSERF